jgi:hypothetical protein
VRAALRSFEPAFFDAPTRQLSGGDWSGLTQAGPKRLHQIDHLAARGLFRPGGNDLASGNLLLDRGEDALLLFVDKPGGVIRFLGALLNQPQCQVELDICNIHQLDVQVIERAHLVRVEKLLQHQAAIRRERRALG